MEWCVDPGSSSGRTPRSERGDRGSTPCPGARASSSAGRAPLLQRGSGWFDSSLAHSSRVTVAQPVERSPETRGVAGSIPAGHIHGSVAQLAERPALTREGAGSTPAGATSWKGCHWCGIPPRKRVGLRALGVRLPLLPLHSGVVELVRRATVNRERQVRVLPPELTCPRGRSGDDAGPSTRKLRVRAPPGVLRGTERLGRR